MATSPSGVREQLLDTALGLFVRRGIASVGINEIVAGSGVAKDTLYRLFGTKDGLVAATLDRYGQDLPWLRFLREAAAQVGPADSGDQPRDPAAARAQLLAVIDQVVAWTAQADWSGCYLLTAAAELRGSPDQPAHRIVRGYHQEAHQLLRRLAAAAGAAEPDTLAAELHRVIYGMLVEAMVASPATAAAARRQAEALLLASVAPPGRSGSS